METEEKNYTITISSSFEDGIFTLKVAFEVTGDESFGLIFQNLSGKLERLWLRIENVETGLQLSPSRYRVILLKSGTIAKSRVLLEPGKPFVYELIGTYNAPSLVFRAATYQLVPGERYRMRVRHSGVRSNEIEVIF